MKTATSRRRTRVSAIMTPLTLLFAMAALPAPATGQVTTLANGNPSAEATYWTAPRLASAKPMPLPLSAMPLTVQPLAAAGGTSLSSPGRPPLLKVLPDYNNVLFAPVLRAAEGQPIEPFMADPTFGYRFTSARMVPDAVAALGAEAQFPNALNGQLFFKVPAGTTVPKGKYVCSATVQRQRVITTAGHCVSDGSGHFFKKFKFVPALRNGVGPFGSWTWTFLAVSNTWHLGGGTVPNGQDVASIELADIGGHSIWEFTGFAGYRIPGLFAGQHVTANGYPCNIDNCNKMHRNDAQAFSGSSNTALIGSDMRGGASGGGWLINWGEYGAGQPPVGVGENAEGQLIAVTSYGPTSASFFYLGASILDSRYVNGSTGVLDVVCANRAGNC